MENLLHGDCLELMKDIPDNSIDLVLTDPPYGTTHCKWDTVIDFELMWKELKRVTKDRGAICLFGSEPFSSHLRLSNLKMFKYDWVWQKTIMTGFLNAKKMPMGNYELTSVFYSKPPLYNPQMTEGLPYKDVGRKNKEIYTPENHTVRQGLKRQDLVNKGLRYPNRIIKFSNPNNNKVHPTQKPVALLEYLIKTYTLENETVLDFTMGSGSTGVAAKNLNRKFIGIEMDDKYFKIAEERIAGA